MIETTAPPSFMGHTGGDRRARARSITSRRAATAVTASAFAPVDDPGLVEQRVVEIARGIAGGERE